MSSRYRSGTKSRSMGVAPVNSGGNGGNRSMHFHPYPNGPYGPSGHAITNQRPMGWGFTDEFGTEEVLQPFAKGVQQHWGRFRGGYSYAQNPGGPHTGYMHSSTTHTHPDSISRRRVRGRRY